ncbi:MAG: hypothetical protein IJ728_10240 [Selenomonadaceae bacterium]|nr:hypothetical protein [Selenomonadaceae bacterium]
MLDIFPGISAIILSLGCYAMIGVVIFGVLAFACMDNYGSHKNETMADGLVLGERLRNRDGYTGSIDKSDLVGAIAVCSTDLHPAGTVIVEGEPIDVVTEGDFVTKGDIVKVIKVEGSRVVVRRI